MNVNNLVINKMLGFRMYDRSDNHLMVNILDIKDGTLDINGETVYSKDSEGSKIAGFDREKEATFSCSSTLFDLNLFAAQAGTDKKVAGEDGVSLTVPFTDILVAEDNHSSGHKITLSETPIDGSLVEIGLMNDDGSIKKFFTLNSAPSGTQFSLAEKEITLPTDAAVKPGTRWFVSYDVKVDNNAISIAGDADASTKAGKCVVDVLFCDPCNQNVDYFGYLIFPNGKLKNEASIELNTEAAQKFTIEAMKDWCSRDKRLYELVVADIEKTA